MLRALRGSLPPPASAAPVSDYETMESTDRARRPYTPPRLAVYGRLEELTLSNSDPNNKNDPVQGMQNLKT